MRVRVVFAAMAVAAVFVGAAEAAPRYTALGDSFAAGPLIPAPLAPLGCLKSSSNYGRIAQRTLAYEEYRDATCSGAETGDMFAPQNVSPGGPNPRQLDSLSVENKLVTLTIGGNDIGFSDLAQDCVSVLPFGSPCRDQYTRGGDQISARIAETAPKVDEVLAGIRARSPDAKILVVNYSAIFPHTGSGCWPRMPVAPADVRWLRSKHEELNAMLAAEASKDDRAVIVDVYGASRGRDACAGSGARWVEPYVPGNAAAPYIPTSGGCRRWRRWWWRTRTTRETARCGVAGSRRTLRRMLTSLVKIGAVAVVLALAAAAPAAADSIAYIKDGDVWLAAPDGGHQQRITRTGNYSYVSQADTGEMIALAPGERLHKLSRTGKVLADFGTVVSDGMPQAGPVNRFHGPFNPEISPDGTKVAFEWFNDSYSEGTGCSDATVPPCFVYKQSQGVAITHADRYTGPEAFGLMTGWIYPHWMSNDMLLRSYSGAIMNDDAVFTAVGAGLADSQLDPWFFDEWGYGVDDVELSRDLQTVVGIAGQASEKLRVYRTLMHPFGAPDWNHTPFREGNQPVAQPCFELLDPVGGKFQSTSLAPDGHGSPTASATASGSRRWTAPRRAPAGSRFPAAASPIGARPTSRRRSRRARRPSALGRRAGRSR